MSDLNNKDLKESQMRPSVTKKDFTIRDQFAIAALPQVMLSWRGGRPYDFEDCAGDAENIAINSYLMADAMLKQREL